MCGIAGIIYKHKALAEFSRFQASSSLLNHRGPDHAGELIHQNVGLYHYRLSILDLDKRSNQPFGDADKKNFIIYNGELYNYRELKAKYQLQQETTSDTEILFKLYKEQGNSILPELNGIYAFAFYDINNSTLSLVRDRFGVKPFYYYEDQDTFIFASEAKVILHYIREIRINYQALSEFLWYGSSVSEQTLIEGVRKLEPGSVLEINTESFEKKQSNYWSIRKDVLPLKNTDTIEQAISNSRKLVEQAVERQCISDVPVGAYLSGGVDSSTVVAFASRFTSGKLNTYSVEFDYTRGNRSELPEARLVAKKFGTDHHEFTVETKHLDGDLADLIFQYDEPFADPAALPLHLMAKSCKGLVKVILQGDGGDEVFAGYGRHLDFSELKMRQIASKVFSNFWPSKIYRQQMKERSFILNQKNDARKMALIVAMDYKFKPELAFYGKWSDKLKKTNPFAAYDLRNEKFKSLDPMQKMLYTDMEVILGHTFLEKVDKVNMFHSIEARVPFLDNDLVNYVMSLPSSRKIQERRTKYLLRKAMEGILPEEILRGGKKSFDIPIREWLGSTLYTYTKDRIQNAQGKYSFLNIPYVLSLLEEHRSGKSDHTVILWRILVLIIWLDFYRDKVVFN